MFRAVDLSAAPPVARMPIRPTLLSEGALYAADAMDIEFLYQVKRERVYRLHSFLYLHYMSALFELHGFTLYNNNACSSGAFALAVAADRIRTGEAAAVVVAGGDVPEDGTKYSWFQDLG